MEVRLLVRAAKRLRLSPIVRTAFNARHNSSQSSRPEQAHPVGEFYEILLEDHTPSGVPSTTIAASLNQPTPSKTPTGLSQAAKDEIAAKASVVFGSRLAGPAERRAEIARGSTKINGVTVPPRPAEPDNCCMGGCVNCVWDRYRDEIEEWSFAKKKADAAGKKNEQRTGMKEAQVPLAMSIDDDGGGSDTNWGTGLETDMASEDLFKGVPIGIREFMKQEKKLKEKHARERTSGG